MSENAFDWSVFDGYEDNFVPEQQGGFRPGLDSLPDGAYDFEVVDASPDHIKGDPVIRLGLRVAGGAVVQRLYWVASQEGINGFGADLCIFGIAADEWKRQGKKLGEAIREAIAKLPGIRFKGTKRSYQKNSGGTGHALNVLCRIAGSSMPPPPSFSGPAPSAAPLQGQVINPPPNNPVNVADIPF